jgi:hypothetical protein
MTKTFCFLMLLISITGTIFAQNQATKADKTFEIPPNYASRRFTIDLGRGNKMQIELVALEDLKRFTNIDSLIRSFFKDIEPLKDSLGDESFSRRIDYVTDSMGLVKIRIQQIRPKGSSFVVKDGDAAVLKLEQDTINFLGAVPFVADYTLRKPFRDTRYYRVSFFCERPVRPFPIRGWKPE